MPENVIHDRFFQGQLKPDLRLVGYIEPHRVSESQGVLKKWN